MGVVTNDQGKYLVDTAFVRLADLPAVEVTGGCFCCNYHDLNNQLSRLLDEAHPDVVFAESVGSCADIVAKVVKPLLAYGDERIQPSTYSVFVDSRLLLRWVEGKMLPFSEDVVYIFSQQLQEAGLLVMNKVDLLNFSDRAKLANWAETRSNGGMWRFQNSLSAESVAGWVYLLEGGDLSLPERTLNLDYERYGRGEAQMAWLDESLYFEFSAGNSRMVIIRIIEAILDILRADGVGIGHLKFFLQDGAHDIKVSLTGVLEEDWDQALPKELGDKVQMLVNMCAETSAEQLHQFFLWALHEVQQRYAYDFTETNLDYFHPAKHDPTFRLG